MLQIEVCRRSQIFYYNVGSLQTMAIIIFLHIFTVYCNEYRGFAAPINRRVKWMPPHGSPSQVKRIFLSFFFQDFVIINLDLDWSLVKEYDWLIDLFKYFVTDCIHSNEEFLLCLGYLSRTFTIHRLAGEVGDYCHIFSWAIAAGSSSLHIASSRTRTGNLWFSLTSH